MRNIPPMDEENVLFKRKMYCAPRLIGQICKNGGKMTERKDTKYRRDRKKNTV